MPTKIRMKFEPKAFSEILCNDAVHGLVQGEVDKMMAIVGDDYSKEVKVARAYKSERVIGVIGALSYAARYDNAANDTLLRAVNAL